MHSIEQRRQHHQDVPNEVFLAEIYSYQGKYEEAAALYKKLGKTDMAFNLYSELRQFDNAKNFVDTSDDVGSKKLIQKQAEWAKQSDDSSKAVDIYLEAGDNLEAIELIGDNGWIDFLGKQRTRTGKELQTGQKTSLWIRQRLYLD